MPAPMVDPDVDLTDFPHMLLDVRRYRDSDTAGEDFETIALCLMSWCVSWHQKPAGSLPNDDKTLARLLGFGKDGRSIQYMTEARAAGKLRGWVLCDDGRLYHPVVAEKVMEAVASRAKHKARTQKARAALAAMRAGEAPRPKAAASVVFTPVENGETADTSGLYVTAAVTESVTETVAMSVTESKRREGKGREDKISKKESPNGDSVQGAVRAFRMRENWRPNGTGIDGARGLGIDVEEVLSEFRLYWIGREHEPEGRKTDRGWNATWTRRCKDVSKRGTSPRQPAQPPLLGALHAIPGGRTTMPTLGDPAAAWVPLGAKVEKASTGEEFALLNGQRVDLLSRKICEALGLTDPKTRMDWTPLLAWVRDGYGGDEILPVIRQHIAKGGDRPGSLKYFDNSVRRSPRRVA